MKAASIKVEAENGGIIERFTTGHIKPSVRAEDHGVRMKKTARAGSHMLA
jgi:hypothetical protein